MFITYTVSGFEINTDLENITHYVRKLIVTKTGTDNCDTNYTWDSSTTSCKQSCNSTSINGYTVPEMMTHDESTTLTKTVSIDHGKREYEQTFTCNDGTWDTGSESNIDNTCDSGYEWISPNCEPKDCTSTNYDNFSFSDTEHNETATATKTYSISNGTRKEKAEYDCKLGSWENFNNWITDVSCDVGYYQE